MLVTLERGLAGSPGPSDHLCTLLNATSLSSRITFARASSATRYTAAGLLETVDADTARFDHHPLTGAPRGLLVEDSRTNEWQQSTDLSTWTANTNNTLTVNQLTSPDGTQNAALLVPDATSGTHWLGAPNTAVITAGAAFSLSGHFKRNGTGANRYFRLGVRNASFETVGVDIDLETGTAQAFTSTGAQSVGSVEIQDAGNGWFRVIAHNCVLDGSTTSTIYNGAFVTALGGSQTFTGDGTNGIGLYGMQFETGAFASSYIPTAASAATRAADTAVVTGADFSSGWFNPLEGTALIQGELAGVESDFRLLYDFSDGTFDNRIYTLRGGDGAPKIGIASNGVNVDAADAGKNIAAASPFAHAFAWADGDMAASYNGGATISGVSALPSGIDNLRIGSALDGGARASLWLTRLAVYNRRLANAKLREITS